MASDGEHQTLLMDFKAKLEKAGVTVPATMQPDGNTDAVLMRYLKARKFKLDEAYKQLQETIAWREKNDVDSYLSRSLGPEKEASVRRNMPIGHVGCDKEGRVVYMEGTVLMNLAAMAADGVTTEDFIFCQVRNMEHVVRVKMVEAQKAAGHKVDRLVVISDFTGACMTAMNPRNLSIVKEANSIFSMHYPEFIEKILVVNPPKIMSALWKIIQVFLDEGTQSKITFVKEDHALLHEVVDKAILPPQLGGTRAADDHFMTTSDGFVPKEWKELDAEIVRRAASSANVTKLGSDIKSINITASV